MKVKIGDKIYLDEDQPIMVILSESDKVNISNMDNEHFKYLSGPDSWSEEDLREFMKTKE